jgi:hypothetical protein
LINGLLKVLGEWKLILDSSLNNDVVTSDFIKDYLDRVKSYNKAFKAFLSDDLIHVD